MTPKWSLVFTKKADKEFSKIPKIEQRKILSYLEKYAIEQNPRKVGKSLRGELSNFWRYRVGNYRIICDLQDNLLRVMIISIGHRKDIYE